MNFNGSGFLIGAFLVMPLALLGVWLWLLQRATPMQQRVKSSRRALLAVASWVIGWSFLGLAGVLDVWDTRPPRAFVMILVLLGVCFGLIRSSVGERLASSLSERSLIGLQAFRMPLELMMYRAAIEGLMPLQMSFAGYNYEIITGSAAALLWLASTLGKRPLPRWVAWSFNLFGLGTLLTILVIAVVSMPTFALFGPERLNTWIAHFPYITLPSVMVPVALFGHLLLWRKLWRGSPNAKQVLLSA